VVPDAEIVGNNNIFVRDGFITDTAGLIVGRHAMNYDAISNPAIISTLLV
jgi:hypothetical protein